MVEKKQGLQPTKYDEIIVRDRLAIISISGEGDEFGFGELREYA